MNEIIEKLPLDRLKSATIKPGGDVVLEFYREDEFQKSHNRLIARWSEFANQCTGPGIKAEANG